MSRISLCTGRMLPIRWIFPVGGVFLTIALLALAFGALDGSRSQMWKAASAQIELGERLEWRRFIILNASLRRADELNRLRELPDTPPRADIVAETPKVAGLPADRSPDPKDSDEAAADVQRPTALAIEYPVGVAPIEIGESMSIEYPVAAAPEEKPPMNRTPQQVNSRNREGVQHVRRRARALTNREPPRPQNVFEFPFGNQQATPALSSNNYFGNQAGQPPTPSAAHQRASRGQRVGAPPSAAASIAPPGTTPAEQSRQLTSATTKPGRGHRRANSTARMAPAAATAIAPVSPMPTSALSTTPSW